MPPDRHAPAAERIRPIVRGLRRAYPETTIALDFTNPLECLVATILAAQSTDARVNIVTKDLFQKYRKPEDYLKVPEEELQVDIQSTGFFRQKTRALKGMSETLLTDFDGEVPSTIAELMRLKGVARKTANVVQNACFPEAALKDPDAGIAVDTHVGRISVRLGLTKHDSKEAVKIEQDLMGVVPKKERPKISHLFIDHGRQICDAKKPQCGVCPIERLCPSSQIAGCPDL
ncbi:MAG: endonuclease III, partial [Actinobacteria bacterium]|nr:endonuclease III [Actinomycetota bacterium]